MPERTKKSKYKGRRGDFAPLFMKKCRKMSFFLRNIWSVKKNVVPLHRFSADVLRGEAIKAEK